MSAGRSQMRRVGGTLFGALLAVATASGAAVGLTSGIASAAAPETTTVTLNPVTSPVPYGSEGQTFTGTVSGPTGDGYPTTGAVAILTTGSVTACTVASVTGGSGHSANFTCHLAASKLPPGSYKVHARYAGGDSSMSGFTFNPGTSSAQTLKVTALSESTTTSLNAITATVAHGHEAQTFSGKVTGVTGDGYPEGTVKVEATTTTVCSASAAGTSTYVAKFSCTMSTSALGTGTYHVHAHYAGGSSSVTGYDYGTSTSATRTLAVVTPTSETTTTTLNALPHETVVYGAEEQTFTGKVTGKAGDGWPEGTVTVKATGTTTLCTATLTEESSDVGSFTCKQSTASKLNPGKTYTLRAYYAGGASSTVHFEYSASTSTITRRSLTVVSGTSTTTTLSLNHTSRPLGSETTETFSVTVTGRTGDGYPKGTVKIVTSTSKTLCTGDLSETTTDSSTASCSLGKSTLAAGSYEVEATYAPTQTHSSSTTGVNYGPSTSASKSFKVTSGVTTTSTLSLNATSRRSGDETAEIFSVTVTGATGDGYPLGTVKVKTSGTTLCTRTTPTSHTSDTSTFTCSPRASALAVGTYSVEATYTPAATSSSTSSVTYAPSTSRSETFSVTGTKSATRIYGSTPDATAAQELEKVFPGARGTCPGSSGDRPVVLATDAHYPDALAASYLAKWLGTGMLLTPTSSMTDATLTALREEGITHVYVVGGPLAVSTADVSEVEGQYVYDCGGTTRTGTHITVTRIAGTTQYTTAEDIAETPGSGFVGGADLAGGYDLYNDTTGKSSAAPAAATLRTAILASGAEFQDAEASATLAYADDLPLLLTTPTSLSSQALSALTSLDVTQVILMGGPLAITNAVVTQLVAHGISVLRVAGNDYTDTAAQLADMELGTTSGHEGLGWTPTGGVTVAQGAFYTDGLAGAVVAAHGGAGGGGPEPMLLTESPTSVGSYLTSFLEGAGSRGIDRDGADVTALTILGGPLAVSTTVVTEMEDDL